MAPVPLPQPREQDDFPPLSPAPAVQETAIPGAESLFFSLDHLVIEGGGDDLRLVLEREFSPLMRRRVSLKLGLETLARVNQMYQDRGLLFSRAFLPEQEIGTGTLRVQIIEGRIHRLRLAGEGPWDDPALVDARSRILALHPFNIKVFERYMLLLNDLPGAKFRSFLVPSTDPAAPLGSFDIVLERQTAPPEALLSLNNAGSLYAGPWQSSLRAQSPALAREFDAITATVQGSFPVREAKHLRVEYETPLLGLSGLSGRFSTARGLTRAGDSLTPLEVGGFSREAGLSARYALLRSRAHNIFLEFGLFLKNTHTKILGTQTQEDRLRTFRASATYDSFREGGSSTLLSFEYSRGLNVLGASKRWDDTLSRVDGRPVFDKVSFQAFRHQRLSPRFGLFLGLRGQYAFHSLLSAEEIGFGGQDMGRGYDPSEATADSGLTGSFELRYTPAFSPSGLWPAATPFLFVDAGKLWTRGVADRSVTSLTSAGGGIRFNHPDGWSSTIMVAVPLTYPAQNPQHYANGNSPRFLFFLDRAF